MAALGHLMDQKGALKEPLPTFRGQSEKNRWELGRSKRLDQSSSSELE